MTKQIEDGPVLGLSISGLKCDAAGCDYKDDTAPHDGETYADYLNRPCPKCGASLLTEADMKLMQRMEATARLLNGIGSALGLKPNPDIEYPAIKLEMHGDGSLIINAPVLP